MIRVAIGSKNPAKVKAVEEVLKSYEAEVIMVDTESGVSEQPFSDEETIEGAINRAKNSLLKEQADLAFGLEGGVVETARGIFVCNWGALVTKDHETFLAGGARIPLPEEVGNRLLNGEELGPIMDDYTKKQNIRKKEGAIGVFTNERVIRSQMFEHILNMLIGQYEYNLLTKK